MRLNDGGTRLVPKGMAILLPTAGGKTKDVFTKEGDSPFGHVDSDMRLLKPSYGATDGGTVHKYYMPQYLTFRDMAEAMGGGRTIPDHHLVTPHEITQLVAKQPKRDEDGFLVFPRPNFFFVEGKKRGSRCFVWVGWDDCGWCVNLIRFDLKNEYKWVATCRVFLRA